MFPNNRAQVVADRLISTLDQYCQKITVAGSLRRGSEHVKDVEIVALPKYYLDLFGGYSDQDQLIPAIKEEIGAGSLRLKRLQSASRGEQANAIKNSARYLPLLDARSGVPVDLFIIRPPSDYYWQLMIRTGPWQYSKWLVNQPKRFGWVSKDGAIWRPSVDSNGDLDGTLSPFEFVSEKHVCEILKIPYLKPRDRK